MPSVGSAVRELATGAGEILLKYYKKSYKIEEKKNEGIVTEADKAAEAYLIKKIFRLFPKSSIITEETGEYQGESSLHWVIDPLDGTTNFAHRFPWFCVSIGVFEDGKPRAGVVFQPVSGEMFFAERGKGAKLNGKRIRVSGQNQLRRSLLGTGFYYAKGTALRRDLEKFRRVSEVARGVRRPGSAALDLCHVACGRYDGFWERGLKCWDVAAGTLIVSEAGGRVTNFRGKRTEIDSGEMLATNGKIHHQLVKLVKYGSPKD